MKVLIVAGGTSEKIDNVRSITNTSTGRLGSLIAETFLKRGHEVVYLTTENAIKPSGVVPIIISSTADLLRELTRLLSEQHFDAVIDSMAVSDFTVAHSYSKEEFIADFSRELDQNQDVSQSFAALAKESPIPEKKISSDTENLVLILKKTPKVIQQIKKIQPQTLLVGFKLLVDVSRDELIEVAQASRKKNQATFVIANDLTEVSAEHHHAYFVGEDGVIAEAFTKTEIAERLEKILVTLLKGANSND